MTRTTSKKNNDFSFLITAGWLAAMLSASLPLGAQQATGSITGTITDASHDRGLNGFTVLPGQ
jgi:hypothetical protein